MLHKAIERSAIAANEIARADVDGEDIAFFDVNGSIFATSNTCPHAFCLLHENGVVYGDHVECSCHGSTYDIATGSNINPPASDPLPTYAVEIRGTEIYVEIPSYSAGSTI